MCVHIQYMDLTNITVYKYAHNKCSAKYELNLLTLQYETW